MSADRIPTTDALGPLVRAFGPRTAGMIVRRWARRWLPISALGAVILILYKLSGSTSAFATRQYVFGWFSVFLPVLALWGGFLARPRARLHVHEHGLRYHASERPISIPWAEVRIRAAYRKTATQHGVRTRLYRHALVPPGGGYLIILDDRFEAHAELVAMLLEKTASIVLDRILETLGAGQAYDCNAFALTGEGLVADGRLERWEDVREVEVTNRALHVTPGFHGPYVQVDNAHATVVAIEMLVQQHRPARRSPFR